MQGRRLEEVKVELAAKQQEAAKAAADREAAEAARTDMRYAATDASSAEELRFMDRLRRQAQARGLEITAIGSSLIGKLGGPTQSESELSKLEGIQEVATSVTLRGPYMSLRGFLLDVTAENRLCNVKGLRWERIDTGSEMNVTLARYIKADVGVPK